jgi:hypothetical protein
MSEPRVRRSASGARQGGDEYQHLVAWNRIVRAWHGGHLAAIEIEAIGVGNLDDLVIHGSDGHSEYAQIRYAVDATTPLNQEYLTSSAPRGTSVLQKFLASYRGLGPDGGALRLITNRAADASDPVFSLVDGGSGFLVPQLARVSPRSAAGRARAELAEHLGCSEDELLAFFGVFEFRLGRAHQAELEFAQALMAQAGLRSDPPSIRRGIDLVRTWVLDGRRILTGDELQAEIDGLDIGATDPWGILFVQALRLDVEAVEADEALDWVDLFEGETAAARRRVKDPASYDTVMQPQLEEAAERIVASGLGHVLVRGAFRLPAAFAIGAALPRVRGVELTRRQGPDLWGTDATSQGSTALADVRGEDNADVRTELSQGPDLAIVIGLTNNPHGDVVAYARAASLPVREVLALRPLAGSADDVVSGPGNAVAWAQTLRDAVRTEMSRYRGYGVHLFFACPSAVALFLGHRWNRVAPTLTYEDLNGGSYQPAFYVSA